MMYSNNSPVADINTVRTLTYTSWRTANGPVEHTVTALVTEAIIVSLAVCVCVCVYTLIQSLLIERRQDSF